MSINDIEKLIDIIYKIDLSLSSVNSNHAHIKYAEIFEKTLSGGLQLSFSVYEGISKYNSSPESLDRR